MPLLPQDTLRLKTCAVLLLSLAPLLDPENNDQVFPRTFAGVLPWTP
jgi:hypothetical protein